MGGGGGGIEIDSSEPSTKTAGMIWVVFVAIALTDSFKISTSSDNCLIPIASTSWVNLARSSSTDKIFESAARETFLFDCSACSVSILFCSIIFSISFSDLSSCSFTSGF